MCFKALDPDDPDVRSILDKVIQTAFKFVFPFEIRFADHLPMYTCKQCSWNVLDFYYYSEEVQKNQEVLMIQRLAEQKAAQDCSEQYELKKENIAPNDTGLTEEHLIACKIELDDVHVANELHPDLMEYSFEAFDQTNTSITCEEYKISTDGYDIGAECEKQPVVVHERGGDGEVNEEKSSFSLTELFSVIDSELQQGNQTKRVNKSDVSRKLKSKRCSKTRGEKFGCYQCIRIFRTKSSLDRHIASHEYEKCTVCKKTLRRSSIRLHKLRVHSEKESNEEKSQS